MWEFFVRLCFGMHYFMSFLGLLTPLDRAGCFAFIVFRMSCYCKCPVALPHSAMGGSAVCDYGVSLSYSLFVGVSRCDLLHFI